MADFIDLHFQGTPRVIATAILDGADGLTLIDPGPTSCLGSLEHGLRQRGAQLADVRNLLLTHIHLDHAGATGSIVARAPQARVFVHEVGAPHMIDPAKLLASATRLYGDKMDELWGAFLPVSADRVHALTGGERLTLGAGVRVAYTPGHAKHHVSYLEESSGVAYVGDTAGVCVRHNCVLAPTPPPDIDLDAWRRSLATIDTWAPDALFLTHFGLSGPAHEHISLMSTKLDETAAMAKASFGAGTTDDERIRWFVEALRRDVRRCLSEIEAKSVEVAAPFDQIWQGLARYWRKRGEIA